VTLTMHGSAKPVAFLQIASGRGVCLVGVGP
jgi:hypothetical protein